jgi:hypothetical protein
MDLSSFDHGTVIFEGFEGRRNVKPIQRLLTQFFAILRITSDRSVDPRVGLGE